MTDDVARRAANLERIIGEIYEVHDLGEITHFEHHVAPHQHREGLTIDVFRVVFAGGRQSEFTYAQMRTWLQGFFAGRRYPRAAPAPARSGG